MVTSHTLWLMQAVSLALLGRCQQIKLGHAGKDTIITNKRNAVLHSYRRDPEVVRVDLLGQGMPQTYTVKTQLSRRPCELIVARSDGRAGYTLVKLTKPGLSPATFVRAEVEFHDRLDRDDEDPSRNKITVALSKRDASGCQASRENASIDDDRSALAA